MSTPTDAIIEKLQKILARADPTRNPSQAEVETAMKMAQELALKHGVDLASVSTEDDKAPGLEAAHSFEGLKTTEEKVYHRYILWVLCRCFGVKTILTHQWLNGRLQKVVCIVGEKVDAVIARNCFKYLEQVFPAALTDYAGQNSEKTPRAMQHGFYNGMVDGIVSNYARAVKAATASNPGLQLVLVNKESLVKAETARLFPKLRTRTGGARGMDGDAVGAGYQAGKSVKLNAGALT